MLALNIIVKDLAAATVALEKGLRHLWLLDPHFSCGCPSPQGFSKSSLQALTAQYPDTCFYLLADKIFHQVDFESLALHLQNYGDLYEGIVGQDIGLMGYCQSQHPQLKRIWHDSFMSISQASLTVLEQLGIHRIVLSHQIPLESIQHFQLSQPAIIYLQGPILIQYSKRQYKQDSTQSRLKSPLYVAEDTELPGRRFRFIESQLGTMMYAHFDRFLLPFLEKLAAYEGLIDTRFYDKDTVKLILEAYLGKDIDYKESIKNIQTQSQTPQKPGFFMANKTNQDWRNQKMELKANHHILGEVISAVEADWIICESLKPLRAGQRIHFISPCQHKKECVLDEIYDLSGKALAKDHAETLVKIKKIKHMGERSLLLDIE